MTESTGTTFESASSAEDVALTQGAAEADAPTVQVAQAAVEVPMPQPGETVRIPVAAGQTIRFAFDVAEAQPSQADGDLVLEINGGTVVLEGFGTAASGEILLEITNADGTVINMADFLVALGVSPEAEVLPAAGGEPAGALPGTVPNGGAGFAPGQAPTILASLDPTGPVDPSALLYRVPEREPRLFETDEELDPAGGEIESSFTTTIDGGEGGYGYDHPSAVIGEFAGGFEDWAPNQHLGDGSPSPMKLNLGLVPTDNEELVSVTISNIPVGVTIFAPGQMVLGNGGNGITIQAADLDDVYVLPAGQTDGDLVLELSAEIRDPDSGIVSEVTGTVTGIVDAAADKPEGVGADAPSEVGLGTEVTFEVEAQFGDWTDGSEAQFLLVELPAGWGNPNGYATEIFAAGNPWGIPEGVYVRVPATVDGGTGIGTAQLTLQAPVSLPQGTGAETFHFGVVGKSVETPGDGELTAANDVSYTPIGESSQLPEIPVTVVKPTISIDDVTVDEDAGTATFTVTLHGAVGVSVALGYATGDGSAADGAGESGAGIPDYAATSGTLTFPPSDAATQTLTITVPVTDDQVFENPESFLVDLLGVDGTVVDIPGSDLQGVGTIIDNDPVPAITISDGQPLPQEEPDAAGDGSTTIAFTVTLSNPSSQTVTVAYRTVSGTALEGVDFENESGLLTFLPGETTKTIEIEVSGDDIDELLEQFTVELTSPTNASIADGEGVGQIEDTDPTPVLTIDDSSVKEGGKLTFTLSLSNPSSGDIVLDLAAGKPGSATPGADYETASFQYFNGTNWVAAGGPDGTLVTIPAGQTSLKVRIDSHEDWTDEPNETLTLSATPTGDSAAVDASDTGIGTIIDDDPVPTLTILDTVTVEGGPLTFGLVLSNPSSGDIVLDLAAGTPGSATPGVDYETMSFEYYDGSNWMAASGPNGTQVTIPAGKLGLLVRVDSHEDNVDEAHETLTLSATPAAGSAPVDASDAGTGLILDDDAKPVLTIADASATEGEGLIFTLSLSNPSAGDIVLNLAAGNPGSATGGIDYETLTFEYFDGTNWVAAGGPNGTQVTIGAGQTSLQVRVDSLQDGIHELSETFTLSAAKAAGSADVATGDKGTGTILDDDPQPTISISDGQPVSQAEPDAASDAPTRISFTVTLSNPSSQAVTVAYQTVGGTALEGIDFESKSGLITFAPGEITKTIEVDVYGDDIDELLEQFTVELSAPVNATILDGQGIGKIADIDAAPVLTIGNASASEGDGLVFTLSLSNPSAGDIVLDLAAGMPGSATPDVDYATTAFEYFDGANWVAAGGPDGTLVTIPAGQTQLQVRVGTTEDSTNEPDETLTLSATPAAGSADVDTSDTGTGTILDDEPAPEVSISDAQANEGDPLVFTVSLSGPTSENVVLALQAGTPGSAAPGTDYETTTFRYSIDGGATWIDAANGNEVTIPAGTTAILVEVDTNDDGTVESDETMTLSVGSVVSGALSGWSDTGTGMIVDDDVSFQVTVTSEGAANDLPTQSATIGEESSSDDQGQFQIAMNGFPLSGADQASVTVTIGGDAAAGAGGDFTQAVAAAIQAGAAAAGVGVVDNGNGTVTLTWSAASTAATVLVDLTAVDDDLAETLEFLTLSLGTPTATGGTASVVAGQGSAELQITDADNAITFSIAADKEAISEEGGEAATFTLSLGGFPLAAGNTASIEVSAGGTAGAADYGPALLAALQNAVAGLPGVNLIGSTLHFTAAYDGSPISFTVSATDDSLVEGVETIVASLANASVGAGTAAILVPSDTVNITEIDAAVTFSIAADRESISEEGAEAATFTLSLGGFPLAAGNTASVEVSAGGSAGAADYGPALLAALQNAVAGLPGVNLIGSTLHFTSAYDGSPISFTVNATDDSLVEGVETIVASLANASVGAGTATILVPSDTVSITEIDAAVTFSIAADRESISEEGGEAATFTLSLGGFPLAAGNTASVEVSAGGSAGAADYGPALLAALQNAVAGLPGVNLIGSTLHFTSAYDGSPISFTVNATDDSLVEGVETIVASLANASVGAGTATILVPSDTVSITEIDAAVTFSIAVSSEDASNDAGSQSATVNEETAADNLGTFQIAMSGGPLTGSNQASVTVTIGGDAESGAGGDFTQAVAAAIQAGAAAANVGFVDNGNGTVTLTWSSTSTAQTVEIDLTAFDDNHPDSPETLSLSLGAPAVTNGSAAIGGGQDSATLTVTDDDEYVPDAVSEEVSVVEGSLIDYNLMLVIDKSGSMDDDDLLPGPGFLSRLQLAIDALKNMLEAYDSAAGDIQVQIVTFDSTAQGVFPTPGTFYTVAQAIQKLNQIAANGAGGNTDYDDATELAAGAFPNWPDASATQKNIVYFLSDGDPNPNSDALNDSEQAAWQDALDEKGIEVIAVGVGDGITDTTELGKVAYPADNVILVENDTELGAALLGTLPNILSGNVLDNGDVHGGDGWGAPKIVSVEHDGVVYTTASAGYDAASQTLTITTDLGGKLSISFATGQYTYQAPNVNHATTPDPVEEFTYTIQDANGDTDSATLTIRVEDGEPVAYDNYAVVTEGRLVEQTTLVEGFEKDSGWKRVGDAWRSDDHDTQGNRSAAMSTSSWYGAKSIWSLESDLGLPAGAIKNLLGNGEPNNPVEGSGVAKSFVVNTTENSVDIAFDWHFDASSSGYNDAAVYFIKVDGVVMKSAVLQRKSDGDDSGTEEVTLSVTPGSHTVEVIWAAVDVRDDYDNSTLYVDNLTMTDMVPTTDNVVTGNIIADANDDPLSGDPVGARDVMGSDGATLTRIDYVDAAGNPAFALVPADGASVTVETQNGFLTIDKSGSYSYAAKVNAVTSGAVEQDEFTYTLTDGDGDTDTAKLTIDIHDSVLPPPAEPPSILSGTIVTNTNVAHQPLRLTLTQLGNPLNSFSTVLMLDSQGQQSSALDFAVDVGFAIDNSQQYLVTLTSLNGEKVNVTDFVLEGVTIKDQSGNIQLGFPNTGDGLTQVIQPNAPGTAGIPGDDKDVVYSDDSAPFAAGPTTAQAQAGASVPYIQGTAGDDTLTGSDGIDVIAGGAGDDTIYGGGEMDLLFGDGGDDLLFGGDGDDVIHGGAGNDVIVGGQGADRIDVSAGSDTVVYQSVLDGGDLITGFSTSGAGRDFVDLDTLFDTLNGGIEAESRAGRVQLVQNGDDVTVNIDVSAGTGPGDGSNYVTLATIQGVSVSDLSVGTGPADDIQTGVG